MNTKPVTYGNRKSVIEVRPLGRRLEAQIAKELQDKGFAFMLPNVSLASANELAILSAKRVIVSYQEADGTKLERAAIDALVESNDKFAQFVVDQAKAFQEDLDKAWADDTKN